MWAGDPRMRGQFDIPPAPSRIRRGRRQDVAATIYDDFGVETSKFEPKLDGISLTGPDNRPAAKIEPPAKPKPKAAAQKKAAGAKKQTNRDKFQSTDFHAMLTIYYHNKGKRQEKAGSRIGIIAQQDRD